MGADGSKEQKSGAQKPQQQGRGQQQQQKKANKTSTASAKKANSASNMSVNSANSQTVSRGSQNAAAKRKSRGSHHAQKGVSNMTRNCSTRSTNSKRSVRSAGSAGPGGRPSSPTAYAMKGDNLPSVYHIVNEAQMDSKHPTPYAVEKELDMAFPHPLPVDPKKSADAHPAKDARVRSTRSSDKLTGSNRKSGKSSGSGIMGSQDATDYKALQQRAMHYKNTEPTRQNMRSSGMNDSVKRQGQLKQATGGRYGRMGHE